MEDTDWRPSSCPVCGHYRAAARNPVCANPNCVTQPMGERTMIKKEPERYVWIRANGDATIINDPVELWLDPRFSKTEDRIYRLGEEVEVKVSVEVKNKKPVYRDQNPLDIRYDDAFVARTTLEELKGDTDAST